MNTPFLPEGRRVNGKTTGGTKNEHMNIHHERITSRQRRSSSAARGVRVRSGVAANYVTKKFPFSELLWNCR